MNFKKIDIENWNRKECFDHYYSNVPCTYGVSIKLDITKITKNKLKTLSNHHFSSCSSLLIDTMNSKQISIHKENLEFMTN